MERAILLAGGAGNRLGKHKNKALVGLKGKPMIYYSLEMFEANELISEIIIVSRKEDIEEISRIMAERPYKKVKAVVEGGDSRQQSVRNGFRAVKWKADDIVVIHNSANPFFSDKELREVISGAQRIGAAAVASPAKDTIKEVVGRKVVRTFAREKLVQMQTPQAIRAAIFEKALRKAEEERFEGTDDVSLVEHLGKEVEIVPACENNFKITTAADLERAEMLLQNGDRSFDDEKRENNRHKACLYARQAGRTIEGMHEVRSALRIGLGQDSHRFDFAKKGLWIGGAFLADEPAFEANSDGDVVLHALFNAISSALGGGSISTIADEMCLGKGIKNSSEYLKALFQKYQGQFVIQNVSISLECKRPKIEPIIPEMKRLLGELLGIEENCIGITATSGEGLSACGRGEGVQCSVMVLLRLLP